MLVEMHIHLPSLFPQTALPSVVTNNGTFPDTLISKLPKRNRGPYYDFSFQEAKAYTFCRTAYMTLRKQTAYPGGVEER